MHCCVRALYAHIIIPLKNEPESPFCFGPVIELHADNPTDAISSRNQRRKEGRVRPREARRALGHGGCLRQ